MSTRPQSERVWIISVKCPKVDIPKTPDNYYHWKQSSHVIDAYKDDIEGYNVDDQIKIDCDHGYMFEDLGASITLTCNSDSDWQYTLKDNNITWKPEEKIEQKCKHPETCSVPRNMEIRHDNDYLDKTVYKNEQRVLACKKDFQLFENNKKSNKKEVDATCIKSLESGYFCGYEAMIQFSLDAEYREMDKQNLLFDNKCVELGSSVVKELLTVLKKKLKEYYHNIVVPELEYRIRGTGVEKHTTFIILHVVVVPSFDFGTKKESLNNLTLTLKGMKFPLHFNNKCELGVKQIHLIKSDYCPALEDVNSKGEYTWNETLKNSSPKRLDCKISPESKKATAGCNHCVDGAGCWFLETDYNECPYVNEKTREIDEIMNDQNVSNDKKAEKLQNVTKNMKQEDIKQETYNLGADTIESILNNNETEDKGKVSEQLLDVIDKFASADETTAFKESNATAKYLNALERVVADLPVQSDNKAATKSLENIKLTVRELPKTENKYITFSSSGENINIEPKDETSSAVDTPEDDIVMTIPPEINERINSNSEENRFYFIVFNTTTFFTTQKIYTEQQKLHSKVFSAGVSGQKSIQRIKPPIDFTIKLNKGKSLNKTVCVYWEENENLLPGQRGIEEVETIEANEKFVKCQTDHLTSFAVLMTSTPLEKIHDDILTAASYIGGSLSIIGLTMSLIGLAVFRQIRQPLGTKVHINMAAALLAGLLVFTIGVNHSDKDGDNPSKRWTCFAIGVSIHYFMLAAIFWMGIEGFYLYIKIVRVFGNQSYRFLLKCALFAWGFPLLIVSGAVGWSIENYETQKFCWLKRTPMIAMFMSPVMIVVLINTYMFIRVVNEINKSQNRLKADNMPSNCAKSIDLKEKVIKVRAAISIMVLLGLTWILGPFLLINNVKALNTALNYIFVVCTSLQGFFFFFFHCAIKTDVKERWKTYLGIEVSSHSKLTDFSKTYSNQMPKFKQNIKTTEFSKLGDSASSLNKSLISFKPKNKIRPGSPDEDSDLAVVEF